MKTHKYKYLLFFFFSLSSIIYSQDTTLNYFEFVKKKQFEFDYKFEQKNNLKTTTALNKNYKKFTRWQWFWQNRIDKKGNLNTYHKELFASNNINLHGKHPIITNNDSTWKIIGSEKYPEGTNPSGIKGIGRIDAIVVNPNDDKHVIIGARAGGIWETKNINDSIPYWQCLTNNLPVFTVNDLKIVNNTLYAATSNRNPIQAQGDIRYGLGIIKKRLKDSIWQLPSKTFESKNIAISQRNSNIIYSVGEKYVYKSINAGNSWEKLSDPVTNIATSKIHLTNIEVNPYDDDIIIISGKLNFYNSTNNKEKDILLFKSDDGGNSWIKLTAKLENFINHKIKDANAKDKPISLTTGLKNHISTYLHKGKLFICVQQRYRPNLAYFITLDATWNHFKLFNSLSKNNTYYYKTDNVDVSFIVLNNDEILIGNRKLRLIKNKTHVIKNLDNNYKYLHQDIRVINFDSISGRVLIGTDGGINLSVDNKTPFRFNHFFNKSGNLNLFLAFNMSYLHKDGVRTVRIGTQDTGYYRSDNIDNEWTNWTRFGSFGEGMVYTDPIDPTIVYRINAKGHGGNIHKSINSGKTFKDPKIKVGTYIFSPLEIDKNNTNNLIFDNYKRYDRYTLSLSNNQLDSTFFIDNGIEKLDMGINLALALSEEDPTTFYVARKKYHFKDNGINNSLFKSENFDFKNPSSIRYTELTTNISKLDSTILNNAFITHIELNKTNKDELWISFGNLEKGKKVFHSIDGGKSWMNQSANLPNIPVNIVKYDPVNDLLFVGNDYGVYSYNKTSNQWNRYGNGLPIAIVTSIEIDALENEVIASTHGRSVWTAPIIKTKDFILNKDTIWVTDKNIKGDLIIKKGVSLFLNNITITANNIVIEKNARLNSFNSKIISYNNSNASFFNTTISAKPNSQINLNKTEIKNFTINLHTNSTCNVYGEMNNSLYHTTINIFKNAYYLQNKKTQITLEDKNSTLLFFEGSLLGNAPNSTKISNINFSGNGSIKLKN